MFSLNKMFNINDFDYPKAKRCQINIGTKCSYKCIFCFYKNHRSDNNCNNIYEQLDSVKKYGILDIDITGGEPTEDKNILNYIRYAKSIGIRQIAIITNGNIVSDINILKEYKLAGLNEIVFSLHGYNDSSHDTITGIKGSFKRILQAINNAKELNLLTRFNTTICEYNYNNLDTTHVDLIKFYKPDCQNYIILNFWVDNKDYNYNVSYDIIANKLKLAIDKMDNLIDYINIRYLPFCYMINYEKYIINKYQHIYDYFDWNVELNQLPVIDYKIISSLYGKYSYEKSNIVRDNYYYKKRECLNCKYVYICDGLLKQVSNNQKVYPVLDNKNYIKDPVYYIREYQGLDKYLKKINEYK